MKNKYPIQKHNGQRNYSVVPIAQPTNLAIPPVFRALSEGSRFANHNTAGQCHVTIKLEDRNGNKMTLHSRQQILNLVNGAKGSWFVHDGTDNRRQIRRFKNHVKR